MDAVIHNAGVYLEPSRSTTADGHPKTLAVNTLAPYLLTALIDRPDRLIYLSSGLHHAGAGSLRDIDWTGRQWNAAQAYAESKLQVTALALTLARAWPDVLSNAVDPGWVPTKMGGAEATGDLELGSLTQTWLAVSNDTAATVSSGYWYHRQRQAPAAEARDPAFQDQLMDRLAALTGVALLSAAVASSQIRGEPLSPGPRPTAPRCITPGQAHPRRSELTSVSRAERHCASYQESSQLRWQPRPRRADRHPGRMFCIGSAGRERPLLPRLACFAAFAADGSRRIVRT